jgi:oxygen-independent coproporphyrinogen III oxidase
MPPPPQAHQTITDAASARRLDLAGRQVPRYTSYPTAPHFHAGVDPSTYRHWLGQLSPCATLSLYLHVPFCAAMCAYCGCHTKVTRRPEPGLAYAERLAAEIDLVADATTARRVRHLHWGGGTPSTLGSEGLARLVERLALRFDLAPGLDHAIELDPRFVDAGLAAALAAIGVTRASLGVQDLNPHVQQAIGRIQPRDVVARAAEALRHAGIAALSFDLMYGLPHQSTADLVETIRLVAELAPDRIALFGYAHVPWMKTHQRLIDEASLPDAAARTEQERAARRALVAAGYRAIGLDHFARPDDAMARAHEGGRLRRNFQGYTVDDCDALIGLGASSIGRLPQGYVQNAPDTGTYRRAIDAGLLATVRGLGLTREDRARADIIERLMCGYAADPALVLDHYDLSADLFGTELARLSSLVSDGLARLDDGRIHVTEAGRPYTRVIASLFDARIGNAGRHSAAV